MVQMLVQCMFKVIMFIDVLYVLKSTVINLFNSICDTCNYIE